MRDPFSPLGMSQLELTNVYDDGHALLPIVNVMQIRWVGYFKKSKRYWLLARLPNNKTAVVSQTDFVGADHARIKNITENQVILEQKGKIIKMPLS